MVGRQAGGGTRREPGEGTPVVQALRQRTRRFAGLRAAQRALARTVHPSELEEANRRGQEILILLQGLHARVESSGGWGPVDPGEFARADGELEELSRHTREVLDGVAIAELRATAPQLVSDSPVEAQGLVDLLLEGPLDSDKSLRTLEFLITLLATEEHGGRRIRAREPSEVTPRLAECCRAWLEEGADPDAERAFLSAAGMLDSAEDIGVVRDRMRGYKEKLGRGLLHPRVLAGAIAYNVAMWNRVADLIAGGRAIDHLAGELLGGAEAGGPASTGAGVGEGPAARPAGRGLFERRGFARLEAALRARITGGEVSDELAERVAVACRVDGLRPFEATAFEAGPEDESARLVRAAVSLGLVLRGADVPDKALDRLGLARAELAGPLARELADQMTVAARKLFADSRYDDAFLLSEVKTRHLTSLAEGGGPGSPSRDGERGAAAASRRRGVLGFDLGLPPGVAAGALLLLALPLLASLLWTAAIPPMKVESVNLSELSPFLASGHQHTMGEHTEFLGRLNHGWDYLPASQRKRVVVELGLALRDRGVDSVVLVDEFGRVHARYEQGSVRLEPVALIGDRAAHSSRAPSP